MFTFNFSETISENKKPATQALQLGYELALKERDAMLRENAIAVKEREEALRLAQQLKSERDQALASLDNLSERRTT